MLPDPRTDATTTGVGRDDGDVHEITHADLIACVAADVKLTSSRLVQNDGMRSVLEVLREMEGWIGWPLSYGRCTFSLPFGTESAYDSRW